MPNKMERFTQRARRVLLQAQAETERLQHSYIGTQHLLLGLLCEEHGLARRVLRNLGFEPSSVERNFLLGYHAPKARLDLSPTTKKVIKLAIDESHRMGSHQIGSGHLLLGLVGRNEGLGIVALWSHKIDPEEVRRQTLKVLVSLGKDIAEDNG